VTAAENEPGLLEQPTAQNRSPSGSQPAPPVTDRYDPSPALRRRPDRDGRCTRLRTPAKVARDVGCCFCEEILHPSNCWSSSSPHFCNGFVQATRSTLLQSVS